jgi:hypothetical protein
MDDIGVDPPESLSNVARHFGNAVEAIARLCGSALDAAFAIRELASSFAEALREDWGADKWFARVSALVAGISAGLLGDFQYLWIWPVVVLSPIPSIYQLFRYLKRESDRNARRHKAETPSIPNLHERLDHLAALRQEVGARIVKALMPPLEQRPLAGEVLQEARKVIKSGATAPDISFLLVRAIKHSRNMVAITRGPVDDAFREGVIWPRSEVLNGGEAFQHLTKPFAYRRVVIPFEIGSTEYFLVGLAGATIPDHAILRTSAAATELVLRSVIGDDVQGWRNLLAGGES